MRVYTFTTMDSEKPNPPKTGRRGFLKGGAALAGLAAGVGSAEAQTQGTPLKKIDELIVVHSSPTVEKRLHSLDLVADVSNLTPV